MLRLGRQETIGVRITDLTGNPVAGLDASDVRAALVLPSGVRSKSPYTLVEPDQLLSPGFYTLDLNADDLDEQGPLSILIRPRSAYEPEQVGTDSLHAISLHDGVQGFAVGDAGSILETSDGGQTWTTVASPTTEDLRDVHAVGVSEAYAVGTAGTVLTYDGTSWAVVESGGVTTYFGVYSDTAGEATIVAEDGEIRRLASGVTTQLDDGTTAGSDDLRDIVKVGLSTWWAVGVDATVVVSSDDGSTWSVVTVGTTEDLNAVTFDGTSNGWIAGASGTLLATTDGGSNWSVQTTPTDLNLNTVGFHDALEGWAAGNSGVLIKTTDGGANWTRVDSSQADPLRGLKALGTDSVTLVGGSEGRAIRVVGELAVPSFDEVVIEKTVVDDIAPKIDRILGLSQENYRVSDQLYDANGNLVSAKIRTFPTPDDAINITNPVAVYEVTAFYDTEGRLKDYRMLRID